MSRSGYTDECEDPLAYGGYRQAVHNALRGKRGQALLRDLAAALDAMTDKRLYPGSFATPEGEFCALGALAHHRGILVDDLGDDYDCDPERVAQRFGIAKAMAAEIMDMNDSYHVSMSTTVDVEICGPMRRNWPDYGEHKRRVVIPNTGHAEQRWLAMRRWVGQQLQVTA